MPGDKMTEALLNEYMCSCNALVLTPGSLHFRLTDTSKALDKINTLPRACRVQHKQATTGKIISRAVGLSPKSSVSSGESQAQTQKLSKSTTSS